MLESIFSGLVISTIKGILQSHSGNTDALNIKAYEAIDKTYILFYKEYNEKFGKPHESFLARQSNLELLIKYLTEESKDSIIKKIDRSGYKGTKKAETEAIIRLLEILEEEYKKDIFLGLLLKIKNSTLENKELHKFTHEQIGKLLNEKFSPSNGLKEREVGEIIDGKKALLTAGKLYEKRTKNGDTLTYIWVNNIVYAEIKFISGEVLYYEIDEENNIYSKLPDIPLDVIVPPKFILHKTSKALNRKLTLTSIRGKWGMRLKYIQDNQGFLKNAHLHHCSLSIIPSENKLIITPQNLKNDIDIK